MNTVFLTGWLCADPSVYRSDGEIRAVKFTLAAPGSSGISYISCTAFGGIGRYVADYTGRGMKVWLEGRIENGPNGGSCCGYSDEVAVTCISAIEGTRPVRFVTMDWVPEVTEAVYTDHSGDPYYDNWAIPDEQPLMACSQS